MKNKQLIPSLAHNLNPTPTQCLKCSDHVNELKFLTCCHTFCLKCLKSVVESSQQKDLVPCPVCGKTTPLTGQEVSDLPCNYIVKSFLDSMTRTGTEKKTVPCDQCNQDEIAIHHCKQCKENLCMVHSEAHKRGKSTNTHELDKLIKNNECSVHKGKELLLLCNDCDSIVICKDCAIREHKNHDYRFICDVIDEKRKEHKISLDKVASLTSKVEKDIETIDKMIEGFRDKREKEINKIKKSSEALIEAILKKTAVLKNEVDTLCNLRIGDLEQKKQGLSNLLYTLRYSDEKLADSYNDIELITIERYMKQQLKKLQEKAVKDVNPTANTLFEAKTDTEQLQNLLENSWLLLNYKYDRTRVLNAVKQDGNLLKYVSNELKNDKEVALAAVESNGKAFQYCSNELKNEKSFVLAAIKMNKDALEYASEELKNGEEIQTVLQTQNDTSSRTSGTYLYRRLDNSGNSKKTSGFSFGSTTNALPSAFGFTEPRNDNRGFNFSKLEEINPVTAETSSRGLTFSFSSKNTGFGTVGASGIFGGAESLLSGGSTTGGAGTSTQTRFGDLSGTSIAGTFGAGITTGTGGFGAGVLGASRASTHNFPKFILTQEEAAYMGVFQDLILRYQSITKMREYENYSFEEVRYEYWKASKSLPVPIAFSSDTFGSSFGSGAAATNTGFRGFGFGTNTRTETTTGTGGFGDIAGSAFGGAGAKISPGFGGFSTGTTAETRASDDTLGTKFFGDTAGGLSGFGTGAGNTSIFCFGSNSGRLASETADTSSSSFDGFISERLGSGTASTGNSASGGFGSNSGGLGSETADTSSSSFDGFISERLGSGTASTGNSASGGFASNSGRLASETSSTTTGSFSKSGDSAPNLP